MLEGREKNTSKKSKTTLLQNNLISEKFLKISKSLPNFEIESFCNTL